MQQDLEYLVCEKDSAISQCSVFISENELSKEKFTDFLTIIQIYHKLLKSKFNEEKENASLKIKLERYSEDYFNLCKKYNESKNHIATMATKESIFEGEEKLECLECIKLKEVLEGEKEMKKSMELQMERYKGKFLEEEEKMMKTKKELEAMSNNEMILKERITKIASENQTMERQLSNISVETQKNFQKQTNKIETLSFLITEKEELIKNLSEKLTTYEAEILSLSNRAMDMKENEKTIEILRREVETLTSKSYQIHKSYENMEEEYKIKTKKFEWNSKQEKIKMDDLKVNVINLETKQTENLKLIDSLYEEKMIQNNKVSQMEIRLKEFKHMVHYLKKENSDIEKNYENKLKNMEGTQDQDYEEELSNESSPKIISEIPQDAVDHNYDQFKLAFEDKIEKLGNVIDVLKEEIHTLKVEKDKLSDINVELENRIKFECHKREEVAKEMKRMSCIKVFQNIPFKEKENELKHGKDGKIAEKAYKGFDILAKSLTKLYKEFLSVYVVDLSKKETKEMEGNINSILRSALDMKDIFQDYF